MRNFLKALDRFVLLIEIREPIINDQNYSALQPVSVHEISFVCSLAGRCRL